MTQWSAYSFLLLQANIFHSFIFRTREFKYMENKDPVKLFHVINKRHQEKPRVEKDFVILKWGDSYCCVFWLWILLEFSGSIKDEPMLSTFPAVHRCVQPAWKFAFAFICKSIGEYTSHDTKQSKGVPLSLLAACLDGGAGMGFPLPIPSRTSGLPLILTLGFALKPLMLLKWKLFSPSVFGALHTLKKQQIFALLCLYDGFCLYRSQITSQNL